MKKQFSILIKGLKDSFKDLLPIIAVIAFFQIAILHQIPENIISTAIGLGIVAFGLAVFIYGLDIAIFPLGENLAHEFVKKGSLFWLLFFAFLIGFSTTVAEPALIAIAQKAEIISSGRLDAFWLRIVVALSVGTAITLGIFRIILGHPIHIYIIFGYIIAVLITFFAPKEIVGLAYDSGGVTTSTVTVPLVTALGVGIASNIKGRNPVIDGFGLIAFASLTPMIFVQLYGVAVYNFSEPVETATAAIAAKEIIETSINIHPLMAMLYDFLSIAKDVIPIIAVILFFQYFIIKKPLSNLHKIAGGVFMVILGLYAFMVGLDMGLFPLGESMALQLTEKGNIYLVYLFGFLIGFSTTMAEPALIVVAAKAKEISSGKINDFWLRIFVALGVAAGIALGCYRIVQGDPIHYYLIAGYIVVIIITYFAPKHIIPIAYDSGGVTTSTVTVPLVAALGLGLATNIEGRDPLIDGFGLIAFASLFPMITVMGYGIAAQKIIKKEEPK
ncbi:DUF1538 domain-containing protein [Nitrosophilus alvini]|uniref:DUF1538 domain-containing protein n=1 Tax=Nitrosophilus alvini TaxID=2714855 RepID=UPI00190BB493|nr:DUF1538 domain-containing protein [Nitrosophilus alvini]